MKLKIPDLKAKKSDTTAQKGKKIFTALAVLMLSGVLIGSVSAGQIELINVSAIFPAAAAYLERSVNIGFLNAFLSALFSAGVIVLISFFSGLCAVGQPFQAGLLIYRGICIGTAVSWLYGTYGFNGFAMTVCLAVPATVISSFAIILAAREGIRFSNTIAALLLGAERDTKPLIKLYLLKFAVLSGIIVLSALLDGLLAVIATSI